MTKILGGERMLNLTIGTLMGVGLTLSMVVEFGTSIWPTLLSLAAIVLFLFPSTKGAHPLHSRVIWARRKLLSIGSICIIVPLGIDLYHGNKISLDPYLTIVFFPLAAIAIYRARIGADIFFAGVAGGAIASCALAIYEHFYLGQQRADGYVNAIVFGNICVLYSLTCLIRLEQDYKSSAAFSLLMTIGFLGGAYASLLSGSKGGWLVLALSGVYGIFKFAYIILGSARRATFATLLSIGLIVVIAPSTVKNRLSSGMDGAITWLKTGDVTDGSVSIRLEQWQAGLHTFASSPIYGVSKKEELELRDRLVQQEGYHPAIATMHSFHSELIIQAASRGILGVIYSLASFLLPLIVFMRFRKHQNSKIRALAYAGMFLPIAFFEFGLSITIWNRSDFRFVYISWIVSILSLIAVAMNQSRESQQRPEHE